MRARFALAGLAAALIVFVPSALAIHQFTDVPDANPFHADIAAIKDAGITAGKTCVPPGTPPTYCPTEAITREAMAAFVHRGFGRVASEEVLTDSSIVSGDGLVELADADIVVPGAAGTQLVHLQASFTAFNTNAGCPCNFGIRLHEGGIGGTLLQTTFDMFSVSGTNQRTFTISDVVLASSGVHSYQLSLVTDSGVAVSIQDLNFTASTYAFGWNGTAVVDGDLGGASSSSSGSGPTAGS